MQKYLLSIQFRCVASIRTAFTVIALLTRFSQQLLAKPTIAITLLLLSITSVKAELNSPSAPIRIGITSVILNQQLQFLQKWKAYLEEQLNQPIEFIRQESYGKITTQLLKGDLDFGWICGYPYVQHQTLLELIAVPLYNGKPLYQSYLIVSNSDIEIKSLLDLKDTVFAYSDPDSNSGYLYAQYILIRAGLNPESFFKKSFFTWQHKNTVEAVAVGLAKAGIIDSYIWETMKKQRHPLIEKTRIAYKSRTFGFPPLVTTKHVSPELKKKLQRILLSMNENAQGRYLLEQLNIEGFIQGNTDLFNDILQMHLYIEAENHVPS